MSSHMFFHHMDFRLSLDSCIVSDISDGFYIGVIGFAFLVITISPFPVLSTNCSTPRAIILNIS